ncbi:3-dehydroquinate synthase [Symbiobacterium terraclitae]|uniref:3-dehydroquinate synthase n=1 Tax=Symbiobacterium terraclitae TaxID=557451 RepID=A0ABS4JSE4_9FIRM|nr:3-dehydroquinate synthase [Symbiobacterium terraclitae]
MGEVWVELGEQRYPIHIGAGLLKELGGLVRRRLPQANRALLVTDSHVAPLYGDAARESLVAAGIQTTRAVVGAGESAKSLSQAYSLYSSCVKAELERSSVIVALGGGVVGDLAGFVAATWLRGIPFVQVPTTLLAQVDSSIGGKTGVDLPQGKNLVGAFHQPSLVVADVSVLKSLPRRELAAGMAEVVKYGVIRSEEFLKYVEVQVGNVLAGDPAVLEHVVAESCRIKAEVVAADPREKGLRAILNFGHTVGHAMEAARGYGSWLHGECVAVGMVAAAAIARHSGILQDTDLQVRLERVLERLGLPTRLPSGLEPQELEPFLRRDKKVRDGLIHWVLPLRAGEVTVTPNVAPEAVRWGLESVRR